MEYLMSVNKFLSIVIPTYNRSDYLDCCLAIHIPLIKYYNIQIFISDNASTDNTKEIVIKHSKIYPFIHYSCNDTNLGADENFERALNYPETEYVWLLGDTYQIPGEGILYILNLISKNNNKYDAIILNVANRVSNVPQQDYLDRNKLLSDLGWHMTCMASLIYSTKVIKNANFMRYRKTNFIQTGVIFEYIENKDFFVHWKECISVQSIVIENIKKQSWQDRTFEIWIKQWINFIFSLPPSYSIDIKLKCIMDHGKKSGMFSIKGLLILRSKNILNYKEYKKYINLFELAVKNKKPIIFLISLLPINIVSNFYCLWKFIKK